MIKWIRTSGLSIKNSLSETLYGSLGSEVRVILNSTWTPATPVRTSPVLCSFPEVTYQVVLPESEGQNLALTGLLCSKSLDALRTCAPSGFYLSHSHPGDNIRANGTFQKWTHPGMPPDSGGILRGCPLLGGAMCPNGVSRVGVCGGL